MSKIFGRQLIDTLYNLIEGILYCFMLYKLYLNFSKNQFNSLDDTYLLLFIVLLGVLVFGLIYQNMPIRSLRMRINTVSKPGRDQKEREEKRYEHDNPNYYLNKLSYDYRKLATAVRNTAKLYLVAGLLIAIFGVYIFVSSFFQNLKAPSELNYIEKGFFVYVTRTSSLIFIELIAFFLLKQFRLTNDESRYYDSIKRQIEGHLLLNKLLDYYKIAPSAEIIDKFKIYENLDKLSNGETTIQLESVKSPDAFIELFKSVMDKIPSAPPSKPN
ncbi:hypothetical protein HF329_13645 [Chitinophaga oryzae]|uniref:Uncharacterized protein n=1 Tax=Chitinophaga oryzae TaxID=2725414 RepID=A0AAE7D8N4_9BACT|nr:hypothetical protein [Chitinophaga oryzae]QJB32313.1 hypothetical protein HF329_13645 [Chitinophaga oryzae]